MQVRQDVWHRLRLSHFIGRRRLRISGIASQLAIESHLIILQSEVLQLLLHFDIELQLGLFQFEIPIVLTSFIQACKLFGSGFVFLDWRQETGGSLRLRRLHWLAFRLQRRDLFANDVGGVVQSDFKHFSLHHCKDFGILR